MLSPLALPALVSIGWLEGVMLLAAIYSVLALPPSLTERQRRGPKRREGRRREGEGLSNSYSSLHIYPRSPVFPDSLSLPFLMTVCTGGLDPKLTELDPERNIGMQSRQSIMNIISATTAHT